MCPYFKINMLQKRSLRCICNNDLMYNTFYFIYNILKFDDIVKFNSCSGTEIILCR